MCDRVRAIVYDQLRGKRRPIVAVKNTATHKINKPWPAGTLIIVSRHVKSKPGAAVCHVVLERRTLLRFGRKIIDPHNQLEALYFFGVQGFPSGCRFEIKIVFLREFGEKRQGLLRECDM